MAPRNSTVGRCNHLEASRQGKERLTPSPRDKNALPRQKKTLWGGERRACCVTPDVSYDYQWEGEKKGGGDIDGMGE